MYWSENKILEKDLNLNQNKAKDADTPGFNI